MTELAKAYEAKSVDSKWYEFWESSGFFKADAASKKPAYCIVMPPPNVTGALHMGHALVNTIQDILIRWKRMNGFEALWMPGTDHAGISTQTVVERHLMQTVGKKRKDFPREEFLSHVWRWKEEKQDNILNQLKRIGCSCDWSRLRFTMDEGNNSSVRTMFKKMFDEGLIYRGDYLVNWDPVSQTALADDEVEYEERQSFLWHLKYPLKDGSGFVQIATTRPETMLGDTAIAVSPKDPRYAKFIGQIVVLPLTNREIPIIADRHVDPEFGTGMVKVTPAHDPNDYQMGLTHSLPFINIMTPDAKINANGGKFEGLTMEEARHAVIEALKNLGLVEKIEPHVNRVGVSYRSKATIEPYMSKQWFVRMDGFAVKMRAAIQEGKTQLIPKNWENTYFHWIDNLRDWCISRQLWWGHRIPIWYRKDDASQVICYGGEGLPPEVEKNPADWQQDDDVLDTWFSSALWPFSTLGWPEKTPELSKFYPNSVLVTGHDILFFWVARMVLMGEYATNQVPFPQVFLHGLIYGKSYWRNNANGGITYLGDSERREYELGKPIPKDVFSKWEKMSKSKGNIIDPLEIIEEYGTDAMRMALCASATQAREIDLDRRRFEEFKNFANKVWNGSRFVFMNLDGDSPLTAEEFSQGLDESLLGLEDRWILSKLNHTIQNVNQKLTDYFFDQAAIESYEFFWKEFCAYYLELAKPILFGKAGTPQERKNKQKLLAIILCQAMRLIHPMAPFITEELFQLLKTRLAGISLSKTPVDPYTEEAIKALNSQACMVAPYPHVVRTSDLNLAIEESFALVDAAIYTIRNIRGEMKLPPGMSTDIHISGSSNDPHFSIINDHRHLIAALVKTTSIQMHEKEPTLGFASTGVLNNLRISIPLPEELLKQEQARLVKERERLENSIEKIRTQLSNEEFVSNAPAQLVEKQKTTLLQSENELQEITTKLQVLSSGV
ncbi:MAG TPA: valine--tRNA ligase [Parachlamydiaceae bacterium]|nr:valine--tRNA ligase [Parachlamydiaceae bacterium]